MTYRTNGLRILYKTLVRKVWPRHRKLVVGVLCTVVLVPAAALVFAFAIITPNEQFILTGQEENVIREKDIAVGLVLGSGITNDGRPYQELQGRLDVAADAIEQGYVKKLVLSGDNRFENYNEPEAMKRYLMDSRQIAENKLQVDYAGRSSYESCERAAKVFGLKEMIIFSAQSHLSRAIFLCRHFGIESYGLASTVEANNSRRRELLARGKAVFNVYIYGEKTILGKPIEL